MGWPQIREKKSPAQSSIPIKPPTILGNGQSERKAAGRRFHDQLWLAMRCDFPHAGAMARFLVIDDDTTIRELIRVTLEHAGHRVIPVASGLEAGAILRAESVDVVITDIVMPADSLAMVVELREKHPAVPFIVVSGLSDQDPRTIEAGQLLQAARTLPKPFRLPDLLVVADEVAAGL